MSEYTDKVVVITGASRGLGAGMAQYFATRGLRLGLCARTQPTAPAGAQAVTAAVDVTAPQALQAFAEEVENTFGSIDLWINNAGVLDPVAPLRAI
ncbi:MAG: SDR family NAD(P)-dependent oxidoreductase, partial [Candidatus Competibacteraceae bacterium]|nr:SDR family NAD(P)-dependent oxidoreductase [Candidatus Competibacteraceae bacterium]